MKNSIIETNEYLQDIHPDHFNNVDRLLMDLSDLYHDLRYCIPHWQDTSEIKEAIKYLENILKEN